MIETNVGQEADISKCNLYRFIFNLANFTELNLCDSPKKRYPAKLNYLFLSNGCNIFIFHSHTIHSL